MTDFERHISSVHFTGCAASFGRGKVSSFDLFAQPKPVGATRTGSADSDRDAGYPKACSLSAAHFAEWVLSRRRSARGAPFEPLLRNPNIVELCGRSFQKSGEMVDQATVDAYGPMHAVGESRRGDTLLTSTRAWPKGDCAEPTPTVLVSKANATQWYTWSLHGGP